MIDSKALSLFHELVGRHRRFLITTHMNPDGDAIGSQLGLAEFLRSLGREVWLVGQDATPEGLTFLEDDKLRVEVFDPHGHQAQLSRSDLVVLVDNSAPDRLGSMEPAMLEVAGKTLCIDHHPTRETPWAYNILDEDACATAAIIYELAVDRGWKPGRRAAEALYVGIATDTGFFRFNSTNPQAHEIAAELLGAGVDSARCYQEIYERNSDAFTRLLGHALADVRVDADGALASLRITQEMVERCHAEDVDTSEMTTALLSMDRVRIALLFRELPEGRIKVSLRSKGDVDVHQLATQFGGGGHRNASGIVMNGSLDTVVKSIIRQASALMASRSRG